MSFGVRPEDRLTKPDDPNFVSCGEVLFTRKLVIGGQVRDTIFRAVKGSDKLYDARDLLNDRYGWRGYGDAHTIPSGPHHTTFTAELDESVVGTITLAIDSETGLNLDHTFGVEVDQIRRTETSNICELTRLAFHPGVRSKDMMAGLFHFAFIYGTMVSKCTDLLIEVNPRHACYYETMLGFERIGTVKPNVGVAASAQLMILKVEDIRRSVSRFAGCAESTPSRRSLYYNFFPRLQEEQIRCLLSYSSTRRYDRQDSPSFDAAAIAAKGEYDATTRSQVCRAA